jgi:hypothetical protein
MRLSDKRTQLCALAKTVSVTMPYKLFGPRPVVPPLVHRAIFGSEDEPETDTREGAMADAVIEATPFGLPASVVPRPALVDMGMRELREVVMQPALQIAERAVSGEGGAGGMYGCGASQASRHRYLSAKPAAGVGVLGRTQPRAGCRPATSDAPQPPTPPPRHLPCPFGASCRCAGQKCSTHSTRRCCPTHRCSPP